jgi:hypothetical protein
MAARSFTNCARRQRDTRTQDSPAHLGDHVQFSRERVLPQDAALKGVEEEKSTPETLTTACQAASWLARS